MQYLFFDIECANCDMGTGKICSFGYVLTDSKFNVIEQDDIVINPRAPFKMFSRHKKPYIKFAYSREEFENAPLFTVFYERIRALITGEDRRIFGFAPENDAVFLRSEFERYGLPCIDFTFHDVQRIYKSYCDEGSNLPSLSSACANFQVPLDDEIHKSLDDAYATMCILREICKIENLTVNELLEKHPTCSGHLEDYVISAAYFRKKSPLNFNERNVITGPNIDEFRKFLRLLKRDDSVEKSPFIKGKYICFSLPYEHANFIQMKIIIQRIIDLGGFFTRKSKTCNIFVMKPDSYENKKCVREKFINERIENGKNVQKISFTGFLSLILLQEEDLNAKADEILGEMKTEVENA